MKAWWNISVGKVFAETLSSIPGTQVKSKKLGMVVPVSHPSTVVDVTKRFPGLPRQPG